VTKKMSRIGLGWSRPPGIMHNYVYMETPDPPPPLQDSLGPCIHFWKHEFQNSFGVDRGVWVTKKMSRIIPSKKLISGLSVLVQDKAFLARKKGKCEGGGGILVLLDPNIGLPIPLAVH